MEGAGLVLVATPFSPSEEIFLKMSTDMKKKWRGEGCPENSRPSPINAIGCHCIERGCMWMQPQYFYPNMFMNVVNLIPSTYAFIFRPHPKVYFFSVLLLIPLIVRRRKDICTWHRFSKIYHYCHTELDLFTCLTLCWSLFLFHNTR